MQHEDVTGGSVARQMQHGDVTGGSVTRQIQHEDVTAVVWQDKFSMKM